MTVTATMPNVVKVPPPDQVNFDLLIPKQKTYYDKYKDVDPTRLTQNIINSWTQVIPQPLNPTGNIVFRVLKKFFIIVLLLIAGIAVAALIGGPDASALYYLFTQTIPAIKEAWDSSLNDFLRHSFRDCSIGFFGGLYAVFTVRNRYKPLKPLNAIDRLEIKLHISNVKDDHDFTGRQFFGSLCLALPYGMVGFGIGVGVISLFQHVGFLSDGLSSVVNHTLPVLKSHASEHNAAYIDRFANSFRDALPNKFTGLLMAFVFGRRPMKGTMDDIQLYLCQQNYLHKVHQNKTPHDAPLYFRLFPNWNTTYNDVCTSGPGDITLNAKLGLFIKVVGALSILAACFGWYVLLVIAGK